MKSTFGLTDEQIAANEQFFLNTINMLNENGVWGYPAVQKFYTLRNGKLHGDAEGLEHVKPLVTENFYNTYFALI